MSRELIVEDLRSQVAIVQSAVSSKTDLVIALDNPSQAKLVKAEKLSIPIITIEQIRSALSSQ